MRLCASLPPSFPPVSHGEVWKKAWKPCDLAWQQQNLTYEATSCSTEQVYAVVLRFIWFTEPIARLSERSSTGARTPRHTNCPNWSCLVITYHQTEILRSVNNLSAPDKSFLYITLNKADVPVSFVSVPAAHLIYPQHEELQALFAVSMPWDRAALLDYTKLAWQPACVYCHASGRGYVCAYLHLSFLVRGWSVSDSFHNRSVSVRPTHTNVKRAHIGRMNPRNPHFWHSSVCDLWKAPKWGL